ncbi:MAG: hypothetical protein ACYSUI_24995 [Planctomycetota bacterium]|jgi:hypothetical protein
MTTFASCTSVAVVLLCGFHLTTIAAQACAVDTVSRAELLAAMHEARRPPNDGYDLLATTNTTRFQSAYFQVLIRRAQRRRPTGTLFIRHDYLWWEFLHVAGLAETEYKKAPLSRRWAEAVHQSIRIVFAPPDSIIRTVKQGRMPEVMAANVTLSWPDQPSERNKFSFIDTLSVPKLKVTNHQEIRFRFLVFDDMIMYDQIEGLSGRPLTGLLGVLFKVLGEGSVKYSRSSISTDGLEVVRARAKKIISKTATATINPDGQAEKGIPSGRDDLAEIEAQLKQPFKFEYYPRPSRCESESEVTTSTRIPG